MNRVWRCFHCDEVFRTEEQAIIHFGNSERQRPACSIDIEEYRRMEARAHRWLEEDTDLHRAMNKMANDHKLELIRAEERGYARGLNDAIR
jgi:hypothetical protein